MDSALKTTEKGKRHQVEDQEPENSLRIAELESGIEDYRRTYMSDDGR